MLIPTDTILEERVVRELQEGIPIEKEPFRVLAERLGSDEKRFLTIVAHLKETGLIRNISPIYDTRMLGYDSALVAFRVRPERLEDVAAHVSLHQGVSHNYERQHVFNLWFTLAVPSSGNGMLEGEVERLAQKDGVEEFVVLRTKKMFKIGVRLDPSQDARAKERVERKRHSFMPLTEEEKNVVRITQMDMEPAQRPFLVYAERLEMKEDALIEKLREFHERGVLRRVAAIFRHRRVGFVANGMSVWKVPSQRVEEVGGFVASFKGVSHCYERSIDGNGWDYNLFAMIHGKKTEDVRGVVEEIKKETGIDDCQILYTKREFKKERIRYFI